MTRWLLALGALFAACAPVEAPVSQLVGPDGSRMYHVSCAGSEARCFRLAGQACPFGYDYASTPQRNLLVRCRAAMAPNPYLAYSDPPRPIEEENPYAEKLLANPYSTPAPATPAASHPAPPASSTPAPTPAPVGPSDPGY